MFQLDKQQATITNINQRAEKHGDEKVLGVDVDVTVDVAADFLEQLEPGMRAVFYRVPKDAPEGAAATTLCYPAMGKVPWRIDMKGAAFEIHAKKKEDRVALAVDCKKLTLELLEGGTVRVGFQVQANPTPDELAKVSAFLTSSSGCKVSVRPTDLFAGGQKQAPANDGEQQEE